MSLKCASCVEIEHCSASIGPSVALLFVEKLAGTAEASSKEHFVGFTR